MKTSLTIAAVVCILAVPVLANAADTAAMSAKPVAAKQTYCTDSKTHKRISCKAKPAAGAMMSAKPAGAMSAMKPAAKPSAMMAAKPASKSAMAAPGKGKKCGKGYIATNKVCHK